MKSFGRALSRQVSERKVDRGSLDIRQPNEEPISRMSNMTKLFRIHHLAFAAAAALVVMALGAQDAKAQSQTVNYSASVTVQNTFTVTQTTPLSMGTVAAVASTTAGTQANIVLAGNSGTATTTQGSGGSASRLLVITNPTPGVVSITNAPPSTLFTITQGSTVQLTDPAQTGETQFDFTPAAVCAAFNCTTSAAGALTVNVGGTLATRVQTSGGAEDNGYSDGTYTGTYSITFAF